MATSEKVILDPAAITLGARSAVDLTCWIDNEGADWGEAAIEAVFAQRDRGQVPVDYSIPNRTVEIPLTFSQTRGGTTAMEARAAVQAKASLYQKEGGWLQRTTNAGSIVYADIVDCAFTATSVSGWESADNIDIDAQLTLTVLPDFYADEVTLSDHTETTDAELIFTETSVFGDYPARCRIIVDEDDAENQRGLLYGFRSRHYSSANTAVSAIGAEGLNPLGAGTTVALTGATGGTVVQISPLFPVWSPVLGTDIGGTAALTHTGTNRVHARVYNQGTIDVDVRLSWDVGDLVAPVTNSPWRCPAAGTAGGFYIADLGEVRLDQSPVGVHRWQGQIDARSVSDTAGTTSFSLDRLWIVNADEGYGRLSAPNVIGAASTELQAYDNFTSHTLGSALNALTAPMGGTWGTAVGSVDDFTIGGFGSPSFAFRDAVGDPSVGTGGQFVVLDGSSTLAGIEAQADVAMDGFNLESQIGKEVRGGVVVRYTSTNAWLMAVRRFTYSPSRETRLALYKRVGGGAVTTLGDVKLVNGHQTGFYIVKVTVDADGNVAVYTAPQGATDLGAAQITVAEDPNLATGGALDDGKIGMYDATDLASGTYYRYYDNFLAFTTLAGAITTDAVIYASQSAQLTSQGHFRLDTGGTAYGPVSHVVGDLPRLPVTADGRTTEVFIKGSRGDLESIEDSGIDDISARVYYRPSYLHVP